MVRRLSRLAEIAKGSPVAIKVINLNKARKARKRVDDRQKADENAVRFGQTKHERQLNEARSKKASRDLDDHRIDE